MADWQGSLSCVWLVLHCLAAEAVVVKMVCALASQIKVFPTSGLRPGTALRRRGEGGSPACSAAAVDDPMGQRSDSLYLSSSS